MFMCNGISYRLLFVCPLATDTVLLWLTMESFIRGEKGTLADLVRTLFLKIFCFVSAIFRYLQQSLFSWVSTWRRSQWQPESERAHSGEGYQQCGASGLRQLPHHCCGAGWTHCVVLWRRRQWRVIKWHTQFDLNTSGIIFGIWLKSLEFSFIFVLEHKQSDKNI